MRTFVRLILSSAVFMAAVLPSRADYGMEESFFGEIPSAMGTLTQMSQEKSPVSVTVITADQIKVTPARNLYDVLTVYVPGFDYLTHYDSNHMGLRGLIVDRDYTWLLLVNGRLMNQRSHNGVITELANWDMNDIEKVEVARGPGSVTYGPGAVAGVINITTKNADTAPGTRGGVQYTAPYRSEGGYASTTFDKGSMKGYVYASVNRSEGYRNPAVFYLGRPNATDSGFVPNPTMTYGNDYRDWPQYKLYAEVTSGEWRFWSRFTTSGGNNFVGSGAFLKDTGQNFRTGQRQYTVTAEDNHSFTGKLKLQTVLSFFSLDSQRLDGSTPAGQASARSFRENYAENDLSFKSILHFTPRETWNTALGIEGTYNHLGKGWGSTDDSYIIDDGVDFVSDPNEPSLPHAGGTTFLYHKGFDLYNYALLGEVSKSVTDDFELIASGRMDKNAYSKTDFSPRLAAIYDAGRFGLTKLSLQESIRENTLTQLAAAHYLNAPKPTPERFKGAELSYSNKAKGVQYTLTGFYSDVDILGWNPSALSGSGGTQRNGNLKLAGAELEATYKSAGEKFVLGANHSFAKQVSFKLASGLAGSSISMSDANNYTVPFNALHLYGVGNDRMNWPDQQTKLYSTQQVTDKLKLFQSVRALWGYEGGKNYLVQLQNAANNAAALQKANETINLNAARKNHLFGIDVRLDLSASYQVAKPLTLTLLGQNLARFTRQYRYTYVMDVVTAIQEPATVSLRADYKFGGKAD